MRAPRASVRDVVDSVRDDLRRTCADVAREAGGRAPRHVYLTSPRRVQGQPVTERQQAIHQHVLRDLKDLRAHIKRVLSVFAESAAASDASAGGNARPAAAPASQSANLEWPQEHPAVSTDCGVIATTPSHASVTAVPDAVGSSTPCSSGGRRASACRLVSSSSTSIGASSCSSVSLFTGSSTGGGVASVGVSCDSDGSLSDRHGSPSLNLPSVTLQSFGERLPLRAIARVAAASVADA